MKVSVVIPNLDSPVVDRVVRAVRAQEVRSADEIIVVGQDPHRRLEGLDVQIVDTPEPVFPGAARNLGVMAATGSLLIFLDADCIPEAQWLMAHIARHSRGESVVGGAVLYDDDGYWSVADNLSSFHEFDAAKPAGRRPYLPSLNLSVRAQAWRAVGPMDPQLLSGEDLDWTIRAARKGHFPYFDPEARIWHRPAGRATATAVLRRWYGKGRWMGPVRRRHPKVLGGVPALGVPPLLLILAPLIAAAATARIYGLGGPGWRYPSRMPAVFLTKLAWCWGAAAPMDIGPEGVA